MPRGFTDFIFVGGKYDGLVKNNIPVNVNRPPPQRIFFQQDAYFSQKVKDGDVTVIKGDVEKDKNWLAYAVEIYEKQEKDKRKPGVIYNYLGEKIIDRCSEITQKGSRCLNAALDENDYCAVHQKAQ